MPGGALAVLQIVVLSCLASFPLVHFQVTVLARREYEHIKFDWTETAGGRELEEPDGDQSLRALSMNTHAHKHTVEWKG